ncbi:MAG TPA: alpha/beta hydrolase [Caulobacteraceae bacterium]|nr:alpha/beta hydrolase [Caulobacteraceae bacterium]
MGEAAPLYGTDAAPVPAGAAAEWFSGAGGARLRAALLPAHGKPRGSVVLSGGRTEPIEKYFEVAGELAGRGFTVLMHDWRGQGLSRRLLAEPLKGHARGYDDFLTDYAALVEAFEARLPKPWVAMGHSMGGCLTALALAKGEHRFAAAVLSAPMFAIFTPPVAPALARLLAGAMSGVGLGGALVAGARLAPPPTAFEDNLLTHDARRYARNVAQVEQHPDLALGSPTWGWLAFAFAATGELQHGDGPPHVSTPVTVCAAGADRIVDTGVVRQVTARFPHGRYLEIPGAYHEILQETDEIRARFWAAFDEATAAIR